MRSTLRTPGCRPTPRNVETWEEEPYGIVARRYLHIFGPSTVASFGRWAGIGKTEARDAFAELAGTLAPVSTPVGDRKILAYSRQGHLQAANAEARCRHSFVD